MNLDTVFEDDSHGGVFLSWQNENAFNYAAWRLSDPKTISSIKEFNVYSNYVKNYIIEKDCQSLNTKALSGMSKNSLELLLKLSDKVFSPFKDSALREKIQVIFNVKMNTKKFSMSHFSNIKNLVSLIIHSDLPEYYLLSKMSKALNKDWRNVLQFGSKLNSFREMVRIIRSPEAIDNKIHAADIFYKSLSEMTDHKIVSSWAEVGREIISRLVNWPLIILPGNYSSDAQGFSIPITIDVQYDELERNICINTEGLGKFDWGSALERARVIANRFWAYQHNRLPDHKIRTINASVILDLSHAISVFQILFGTPEDSEKSIGTLIGKSLEVYLAMIIISKFMGLRVFPRIAISGMIGEPIRADGEDIKSNPRNWKFESVGGISAKTSWVAESQNFDRLVLPKISKNKLSNENADIDIRYCFDLLNVVDTVFADTWRRERYIRCPELAYIKHQVQIGNIKLTETKNEVSSPLATVQNTIDWMKKQKRIVANCPKTIHPAHLLKALFFLNNERRNEVALYQPPKKSISFIRLIDETGARFAAILSEVLNSSELNTKNLMQATSKDQSLQALAKILVDVVGGYGTRRLPSPDFIVILVPDVKTINKIFESHPLNLDSLMSKELDKYVYRLLNERYEDQAAKTHARKYGKARIFLVRDRKMARHIQAPVKITTAKKKKFLNSIRKISHLFPGFENRTLYHTLGDESRLLNNKVHDVVEELVKNRYLIYTFAGYFINPNLKFFDPQAVQKIEFIERSVLALAPHLDLDPGMGAMDENAYSVRYLHEAQNQLEYLIRTFSSSIQKNINNHSTTNHNLQHWKNCKHQLSILSKRNWNTLNFIKNDAIMFDKPPFIFEAKEWKSNNGFPQTIYLIGYIHIISAQLTAIKGQKLSNSIVIPSRILLKDLKVALEYVRVSKHDDEEYIFIWSQINQLYAGVKRTKAFKWPMPNGEMLKIENSLIRRVKSYPFKNIDQMVIDRKWLLECSRNKLQSAPAKAYFRRVGRNLFPHYAPFWIDEFVQIDSDLTYGLKMDLKMIWNKKVERKNISLLGEKYLNSSEALKTFNDLIGK